jgi:hypothetical protein
MVIQGLLIRIVEVCGGWRCRRKGLNRRAAETADAADRAALRRYLPGSDDTDLFENRRP